MRQLNPSVLEPKLVLREIVTSKTGSRGARLLRLLPQVESRYDDLCAAIPPFLGLSSSPYVGQDKEALEHCYSVPTAPLNRLKASILRSQPQSIRNWCPYCLIGRASQFDHYLPQ